MRYNPFRITPYLLKVQGKGGTGGEEEESCCLALAERIISGYEGTIIKRQEFLTFLFQFFHPKI